MRIHQASACRIDFCHLAAGQIADHIKVVDHHVHEDAARLFNIGHRRSLRITRTHLHYIYFSDFPGCGRIVDSFMAFVKAAHKANLQLHPSLLNCPE